MTVASVCLPLLIGASACAGAPARPKDELFADFNRLSAKPLVTRDDGDAASRIAEELASSHALDRMTRLEVMQAIGRGDDCVRHRDCAEHGFLDNDWHYTVGQPSAEFAGNVPVLIVGFDGHGDVERVWNLRTHQER